MAKKMIQTPRGTRDLLPEDFKYFDYTIEAFEMEAKKSGFGKIDTPMFEETNLFVRGVGKGTDIVEKEMYTFKDKSGNSLTLRPEGTAPVVRAYLENGMQSKPKPVKLYYMGPLFRYERPQAGRFREFYTFGLEVIGDKDPLHDVTTVSYAWRVLKILGLSDLTLQINSIGCPNCRPKYQKELDVFIKENIKNFCKDCKVRAKKNPLRILDCKEKRCQSFLEEVPIIINNLCKECHNHFREVLEYLDELELDYEINPRLVRGFDYYTKTVFEIWTKKDKGQNTLAAGGRYDGLVELLGGKATPAVGFGAGVDRIVDELKKQKVKVYDLTGVDVFVAQLGEIARKKCMRLMHDLQLEGIGAEGCIEKKKGISDQLKHANNLNVPFTLLIGQKEAYDNTVIIKDMQSGNQEVYPRDKAVKEIKKRLQRS